MARFCPKCAAPVNPGARFCPHCGAVHSPFPPAAPERNGVAPAGKGKRVGGRASLTAGVSVHLASGPLIVLFVLAGIAYLVLLAAGHSDLAQVTGRQPGFLNEQLSSWGYRCDKLEYEFSVNDERYHSSATRISPNGAPVEETIPVRYLPFLPQFNAGNGVLLVVAGPALLGAGVLLLMIRRKA